ncbi:MAG: TIGR00730 family Rossman fold protein [Prevotella sp.]|nr:TIGR00730 family Rossman fold protein [Prevotella sp.]
MNIGIFCSANEKIDPDIIAATRELGRWIGSEGHTLVFGGCNLGLMQCVAQAVHEAGGRTIGVVPSIIEKHGRVSEYVDVTIPTATLSDRKDLLLAHSDVCVALPGGVGTLDEIFTVVAAYTIGYHQKRVILYNVKGFWNSLITVLDELQQQGMLRGHREDYIQVANSLEEVIGSLPLSPSQGGGSKETPTPALPKGGG